jgi:uncharacterized LabA/DUF88 family protein
MSNYIYVDNSNVWIEGQRAAAVKRKLARDLTHALDVNIFDHSWRMDFGALLSLAGGYDKAAVGRAVLFGSKPPDTDTLWEAARRQGFEVVALDRVHGREKKIDTGIATEMISAPLDHHLDPKADRFVLVGGDRDFVPPVQKLTQWGYEVTVVFWDHAARELVDAATTFRSLNRDLHRLTR